MTGRRGTRAPYWDGATSNGCEKSFVKVLKKTSFRSLGIPSWFVRDYGDEFQGVVGGSFDGGTELWHVNVKVGFVRDKPHVPFAKGWKEFADFHNLSEGDRVKFDLVAHNHFVVEADNPRSNSD